jgi:hypothetical protein
MSSRRRSNAQLQLLEGGNEPNLDSGQPAAGIDWVLDERTRQVGLAGVAQAKAILQRVQPPTPLDGQRRAS